jgi:nitrogen fixation protein FixH
MNWGHKLTIGMVLFMCVIIAMVVVSVAQGEIQLVTKNYYEEELKYQEVIDQVGNTRAVAKEKVMTFKGNSKSLMVDLGAFQGIDPSKVTLKLYRPSDAKLDKKLLLSLDEASTAHILLEDYQTGLWKLHLDWENEHKKFSEILTVVIP